VLAADTGNGDVRQRHGDGKHTAPAGGGAQRDVAAKDAGNALDNRQAKAKACGGTAIVTQTLIQYGQVIIIGNQFIAGRKAVATSVAAHRDKPTPCSSACWV